MSRCLNDTAVLAFSEHRLSADEMAHVHAHLDGCDQCLALVAEVARALYQQHPRDPELCCASDSATQKGVSKNA